MCHIVEVESRVTIILIVYSNVFVFDIIHDIRTCMIYY